MRDFISKDSSCPQLSYEYFSVAQPKIQDERHR